MPYDRHMFNRYVSPDSPASMEFAMWMVKEHFSDTIDWMHYCYGAGM